MGLNSDNLFSLFEWKLLIKRLKIGFLFILKSYVLTFFRVFEQPLLRTEVYVAYKLKIPFAP